MGGWVCVCVCGCVRVWMWWGYHKSDDESLICAVAVDGDVGGCMGGWVCL